MQQQKLPATQLALFSKYQVLPDSACFEQYLLSVGIADERHKRIITEAALVGTLVSGGISTHLVIMSDDAGQFNIAGFLNALCWVHAERTINKLIPFSDNNRAAQESVQGQIWEFYRHLKAFKVEPSEPLRLSLSRRFDEIFTLTASKPST